MNNRPVVLQEFYDALKVAYRHHVADPLAKLSTETIFDTLKTPAPVGSGAGSRLPVCEQLHHAMKEDFSAYPALERVAQTFQQLEPLLHWRRRSSGPNASDNYHDGHANAMIAGPAGLEERNDLWIGVTLMAPHVRYPDHTHKPEEVYLVMSQSEFSHGDSGWFTPGIGGTFYNEPNILHAMRSTGTPLFAFWVLWNGKTKL